MEERQKDWLLFFFMAACVILGGYELKLFSDSPQAMAEIGSPVMPVGPNGQPLGTTVQPVITDRTTRPDDPGIQMMRLILIELEVQNQILNQGLQINEDLDALRNDPNIGPQ